MSGLESGFVAVGFDGTPEGIAALRWALIRAAETGVALRVVHCWRSDADPARRDERVRRGRRVDAVWAVENEIDAARALVPVPPEVGMVFSAAPVGPLLVSQSRGAAMLVLGASSTEVLIDPSCGPVSGTCLNQIACPVAVVDRWGNVTTAQPRYPALGLAG